MIWKFAFRELQQNIKFDLLIFILLVLVFSAVAIMGATIQYRFKDFLPFQKELRQTGEFMEAHHAFDWDGYPIMNEDDIKNHLVKTDLVAGMYQVMPIQYGYRNMTVFSYDNMLIQNYEPMLESGVWLSSVQPEDKQLKAVVSYNDIDINVGDTILLNHEVLGEERSVQVEIVGKLSKDTKVLGVNAFVMNQMNCGDIYVNPQELTWTEQPQQNLDSETDFHQAVLFFSNEQLNRHSYFEPSVEGWDGRGFQRELNGPVFIMYENDISEDEILQNKEYLNGISTVLGRKTLSELRRDSIDYILSGMQSFFPIVICLLGLIFLASISIELLTTKKQLRNYAVYYITGLQWNRLFQIHFIHMLYISLSAFAVAGIGYTLIQDDVQHWNIISIGICTIIILVNQLLSVLAPIVLIRKTNPVTLFHEN